MDDSISRQWLMECVEEGWIKFDTEEDENKFIHLVRDIAPPAYPSATDTNVATTDTISRQETIKSVCKMLSNCFNASEEMIESVKITVGEMPSAQRWIPCSERLPEDEEEVIVSVRDDSGDNTLDYSSCGWYACAGDFWVVDNEANERVVAWMPLPKPYCLEGEECERID